MNRPRLTISSNTLFHFTPTRENLLGILRNEFQPHYCLENFELIPGGAPESPEVAVPMVSFCDIPLSQTAEHFKTYGRYGIGLAKDWGKTHQISPVLYAYPKSATVAAIDEVGNFLRRFRENDDESYSASGRQALDQLFRIISYVKPYEGPLWRMDRYTEPIRFYNEREWRYVPRLKQPGPGYGYLLKADFLDPAKRAHAENYIADRRVSFQPSDIRYVIVAEESEILPMIGELRTIKTPKYEPEDVEMLVTRLISAEQIAEDF